MPETALQHYEEVEPPLFFVDEARIIDPLHPFYRDRGEGYTQTLYREKTPTQTIKIKVTKHGRSRP